MCHWSTEPFKREEGGFACWIGLVSVDDFVLLICFPLFLFCGEVFFEGLFYVLFSFVCWNLVLRPYSWLVGSLFVNSLVNVLLCCVYHSLCIFLSSSCLIVDIIILYSCVFSIVLI